MTELGSVYELGSNLADVQQPSPLPIGEYRASVKIAELKASKSSGKPMLVTTYNISPDQYPPDFTDGNPDGETLMVYTSMSETPRSRWMLRKFVEMHGVVPSNRISATDFIGQEVILKVEHEDYQGMPQARGSVVRAV
jgi:Protein of unknown function (DUF669)